LRQSQQRRQQPWQRQQQVPKRHPTLQVRLQRRQVQAWGLELVLVLVLPREQVPEQVLVLPSCHRQRGQQQRSGRPERESSSFRFSLLDRQNL